MGELSERRTPMQTFDPQTLLLRLENARLNKEDTAIDTDAYLEPPDDLAVAYCRIPRRITKFLLNTQTQYRVVGFSYDFEGESREIGVIIKVRTDHEAN